MAPAALTVEGFSLHGWYLPSLLFRLNQYVARTGGLFRMFILS